MLDGIPANGRISGIRGNKNPANRIDAIHSRTCEPRFEPKNRVIVEETGRETSSFIVITRHFHTALLLPLYLTVTDKRVPMVRVALPGSPSPAPSCVHGGIYRAEWSTMSVTVLTLCCRKLVKEPAETLVPLVLWIFLDHCASSLV